MKDRISAINGFGWRIDDYKEDHKKKTLTFTLSTGGFTFDQLMKLSEVLGTTHIEWNTSSDYGCPTCGPDTETFFEASGVKFGGR